MTTEKYILLSTYTKHSQIESQFIYELFEQELIIPKTENDEILIDENDILIIEKLFRLHRDLGINFEGLCTINEMLERIRQLEAEINQMRKRLNLYE